MRGRYKNIMDSILKYFEEMKINDLYFHQSPLLIILLH